MTNTMFPIHAGARASALIAAASLGDVGKVTFARRLRDGIPVAACQLAVFALYVLALSRLRR